MSISTLGAEHAFEEDFDLLQYGLLNDSDMCLEVEQWKCDRIDIYHISNEPKYEYA